MADLVAGIVAYLLAQAPVAAIVSTRIQPIPAPEDLSDYPVVTYQVASDVSGYTLTSSDGVTDSRIVFTCLAASYGVARSLALAIKSALNGYAGTLPNGVIVYESEIKTIVDGFDDGSRISRTAVHAMLQYAD